MTLQTYVAEGFVEDCAELIYRLTDNFQKVDWHKFCKCWKEMEFDILFYGRQSGPEVVEFTEELLQTARLYIVTETDNIESQVVGVFIAYAITIIQPYKNLCSLRLIPKDIPALKKIEAFARRENRRDLLMVLGKLYLYGKTQFHVSVRERAMDISIRKYFDGSTHVPQCIARRWHGRLDRHRVNALEDIAEMESKYTDLKMQAKLAAEAVFPGTNVEVAMFKPEAKNMSESLQKLISGEGVSKDAEGESSISTIKQKAMKNVVDPMKHLQGLNIRKTDKNADPVPSIAKSKTKNRSGKLPSPKRVEEPFSEFSLPTLDIPLKVYQREGSPEAPFRGFTAEEIESSDYAKTADAATTNGYHGKGKGVGKSTNKTDKTKSPASQLTRNTNKGRSPANSGSKRKNNNNDDVTKKKKRKYKNKLNKKLRLNNDFNSDDSNSHSDINYTSDETDEQSKLQISNEKTVVKKSLPKLLDAETSNEKTVVKKSLPKLLHTETTNEKTVKKSLPELLDEEPCKAKELTIQTRGVVKHFMEFEVSDIVIRTERDALQKDIEIEYIDNYKGANAYEEVCELSDNEEISNDKRKVNDLPDLSINAETGSLKSNDEVRVVEQCDGFGDTNHDDNIEVFQVVSDTMETFTQDTFENANKIKTCKNNAKSETIHYASLRAREDDETVKKILSKNQTRKMERRRLKQPNLRSKLKKMGLLPVANFDDNSD